jgi:hypothetical protein
VLKQLNISWAGRLVKHSVVTTVDRNGMNCQETEWCSMGHMGAFGHVSWIMHRPYSLVVSASPDAALSFSSFPAHPFSVASLYPLPTLSLMHSNPPTAEFRRDTTI